VKPTERLVLPALGMAVFLVVWQGVVAATRPDPVRRVTLGFSTPSGGWTSAVVVGDGGRVVATETIALDASDSRDAVERLRGLVGEHQPTLAALPAPAPAPPAGGTPGADLLAAVVDQAKREFGGGLDVEVVPADPSPDPVAEAQARATRLQEARLLRPSWLPGPAEAGRALADMARTGEILRHIVASVFRVAIGFALAVLLGIPLGVALGSFAWLHAFADSVIQGLRPISPIAWLPVATLALGGGDLASIFLIFLASFFPIAVSTAAAVTTVDLKYRRSAENFGVRGVAAARRVILPAALPAILPALRIALGISWVVVVAAEMLGVESGLGYLVLDARNQLRYDRVVAAMVVIGVIGLLLDAAVRRVERSELERRGLIG